MVGGHNAVVWRKLLLVLAVLALVAAGCGRDGGGDDTAAGDADDTATEDGGDATDGDEGDDESEDDDAEVTADPGITDDTITIGGSYPFSGPASGYGTIRAGAEAYFQYVNDQGGIDGRQIEFVTYDDGYEPQRALTNAQRLVEEDEAFALFNTLGTANNLAIWDWANEEEIPHVFVATGASDWGADIDAHPWTIGWQPNYVTESRVYADYVVENHPDATVAVLYQNDAYGEDLLGGFEEAIEGSGVEIIERQSYETTDPDVAPQVGILGESGADVFLNITTPLFGAQAIAAVAQLDWDPVHLLNNVSASKTEVLEPVGLELAQGIISTAYFKDPDSPDWEDDEAMIEYKEALAEYEPDANPNEAFNAYGWTAASTFVEALRQMEEPTREALMESVRNLDVEIPMLLPGVMVETDGTSDGYPIEAMQIQVFEGEHYTLVGDVIEAPGT